MYVADQISREDNQQLDKRSLRFWGWMLPSAAAAAPVHLTSVLSAVDLIMDLFFGGYFRFDVENKEKLNDDIRYIFKATCIAIA